MGPKNNSKGVMVMTTVSAIEEPVSFPWWAVLIQGIFSIIIGILLLAYPGATTLVVIQFIGIYWLVTGIFSLVGIFMDRTMWGWKLFAGVIGIMAGLAIMRHPLWSTFMLPTTMVIFMGVSGLFIGVAGLIGAFRGGGWAAGILGALSMLFGLLLLGTPFIASLALPWIYGVLGIVGGIAATFTAIRLRHE
jgi:uncharacterized membrane protein HdeD (DUF308 family)